MSNGTNSTLDATRPLAVGKQLQIAAHCFAALLSLTGNCLVAFVYAQNSGGRMKTTSNLLLINLSIAVILYTCNNFPMTIYGIVNEKLEWRIEGTFGLVLCKIESLLLHGLFMVCHLGVLAIALERFLIVFFPMRYFVTSTRIKIIIAVVWFSSAALYSPMLYLASVIDIFGSPRCFAKRVPHIQEPWFKIELAVLVSTTFMILLIYITILYRLRCRRIPGQHLHDQVRRANRINRKVTARVVIVLVLFYSCWLPYTTMNVFYFENQIEIMLDPTYGFFIEFLPFLYGALCPWIFPLLHDDFRQGIISLLSSCRRGKRGGVCHIKLATGPAQPNNSSSITGLSIMQ